MPRLKRENPKITIHLQVEAEEKERLKAIAKNMCFIVPSGTRTGEGNPSGLVQAIANLPESKLKQLAKILGVTYEIND